MRLSGSACGSLLNIRSTGIGSQATINLSSIANQPSSYFTKINDIKVLGSNGLNAFQSINAGNNSGINFTDTLAGRDLYWVGGTGNWSDIGHWATTSGGVGGRRV